MILQEKNTSALFTNLDFVLLSVRPPCWILEISQDPLYFHKLPLLLNSAASILYSDRPRRSNTAWVKRQTSRVKLYRKNSRNNKIYKKKIARLYEHKAY